MGVCCDIRVLRAHFCFLGSGFDLFCFAACMFDLFEVL